MPDEIKNPTITITLEEYKELLTIKGKYEELKNIYMPSYPKTNITYRGFDEKELTPPYKLTCDVQEG